MPKEIKYKYNRIVKFYTLFPAFNSAVPLSRTLKDFGIFHSKKASEKDACALFHPNLFWIKNLKSEGNHNALCFKIFCI